MNLRRKRVLAIVNAWSRIVKNGVTSREQAVEILRRCYEELGIEPIRGVALSPDIYDKDMASLYIIGKLGLGVDKEVGEDFMRKLFHVEMAIEDFVNRLEGASSLEELCAGIEEFCRSLDDKLAARVLRYMFTLYYFGFVDRTAFIGYMRKAYRILKPAEETVKRFAKFVVAYEVGKRIAEEEVRNKLDLNMVKNMVALDIGIPNALPSASYIIDVARHFFDIPQELIDSLKGESKQL